MIKIYVMYILKKYFFINDVFINDIIMKFRDIHSNSKSKEKAKLIIKKFLEKANYKRNFMIDP